MPAPPLLEFEIARRFGVDLGIEVVLLAPERVGGVEVLEVGDEPRAVELAVAEIADQRREPATSQQAAGVAHGVLAAHAGPIGERRAGDDDRAEQLGPQRRDHHDRPARLAIADDGRLAIGFGMERDHTFEERRLGVDNVFDRLPGDRLGEKADEIAGMAGLERDADFALRLEAADAGSVPRSRIDDDEWPLIFVDLRVLRRGDRAPARS